MRVVIYAIDNIDLYVAETPMKKAGLDYRAQRDKLVSIGKVDLEPLLDFYNNEEQRLLFKQQFNGNAISMDGSSMAITFHINQYSETYSGQNVFSKNSSNLDQSLAEILRYFLKLANIEIQPNELY